MPLFSRLEKPTLPAWGRPCWARATRSWSTSAAGTRMVDPPSASWYGTFWLASCWVMAPASDDCRFVNRGW